VIYNRHPAYIENLLENVQMEKKLNSIASIKVLTLSILITLCLIFSIGISTSSAQVQFTSDSDWEFSVSGHLPVFLILSNHDSYSSDGSDQFASRISTGFNPASINFNVVAPEYNGIIVSGHFQINNHLQGPSVQNSGLFESRIAEIAISGSFGTFNVGKGFGVFNSLAIGDAGSGMGVGRFLGPEQDSATLGRIGSGYVYANFNPHITYTTPDLGGFTLKLGLINPEKPDGLSNEIETAAPRLEAQADYVIGFESGSLQLWTGGMYQNVSVIDASFDYNITGFDVGLHLQASGFGLKGAYTLTNGVGADGLIGLNLNGTGLDQADVEAAQYYGEATYTSGNFTLGGSFGEGTQDAKSTAVGSSPDITNTLIMGFLRYNVTNNLTMLAEFQNFESDAQANYNAFVLGMQLNF